MLQFGSLNSVMEPRNHLKNGANQKVLNGLGKTISMKELYRMIFLSAGLVLCITSCEFIGKRVNSIGNNIKYETSSLIEKDAEQMADLIVERAEIDLKLVTDKKMSSSYASLCASKDREIAVFIDKMKAKYGSRKNEFSTLLDVKLVAKVNKLGLAPFDDLSLLSGEYSGKVFMAISQW